MKTIPFFGTCSARSELTLASQEIPYPFGLCKIRARFPVGCINEMRLSFFVSMDDFEPAAGKPNGQNVLDELGQVDYIVGDNDAKEMQHTLIVNESGYYIKVYADNQDYYDHDVDVQITIDPILV